MYDKCKEGELMHLGTLIVLIGLIILSGFCLYLILIKFGIIKRVGDSVLNLKNEIEDEKTEEENQNGIKGRDL